ncbi:MAG: FmdB family zinc ribbon protein [Acidimicrobiales bacterium]
MPTYEYACKSCGEHLEIVQSFKDDPLTTCPGCSGQLRKVFGAIGIAFKGSGFYKTDSRAAASADRKSRSAADKNADTKTDGAGGSGDSSSGTPAAAAPSKSDSTSTTPTKTDTKTAGTTTPKSDPKAAASS